MSKQTSLFANKYEEYKQRIEKRLTSALQANVADLKDMVYQAANYSLMAGGKRIRPVLLLAVADLLGYSEAITLDFACALEMIHTYSLIHDDLPSMDNDDLRRGRPTCHITYGEANAILAGDALLNGAYELLLAQIVTANSEGSSIRAAIEIAASAGLKGMIAGQSLDLACQGKQISIQKLEKLHSMKTGALIRASVMSAAELAKADEKTKALLQTYAAAIGLAFQIKDDILDVTGNQEELGKTSGKDQRDQKSTYVNLLGLEAAKEKLNYADKEAKDALAKLAQNTDCDISFLYSLTDFLLARRW